MKTGHLIMAVFLFTVIVFGYAFWPIENQPDFNQKKVFSCSELLTIGIGDIDSRFSVDHDELQTAIENVAQLWSDTIGMPIVEYSEVADISVHLIYAEQQEMTDQEREFRDRLQNERVRIDGMEREYENKNFEYEQELLQYEVEMSNLQRRIDRLNMWVRVNNEAGGFDEDDLRQFDYRKAEVDRKRQELSRTQLRLSRESDEINQMINNLNEQINRKNELVDQYNITFSGARRFTQGSYEWNEKDRSIFIYQFTDINELKLVLAHEVGHALGVEHVSNAKSVMYPTMGSQQWEHLELTEEDKTALIESCVNHNS